MKAHVAWRGGLFLTEGTIGVCLCLLAGGSVCGCICVYTHTHRDTHCIDGVLGYKPRSRDKTPKGPEESRWTKSRHTYIRIFVQSTHVYVYARRRDEILD